MFSNRLNEKRERKEPSTTRFYDCATQFQLQLLFINYIKISLNLIKPFHKRIDRYQHELVFTSAK